MQTVLVLKGTCGSGKSTFAKELLKNDKSYKRLNNDDLRAQFDFSVWSLENEKLINNASDLLLEEFLKQGYNVVIDNVHSSKHHFDRYCKIVGKLFIDCVVEEKPFYVELSTAIERDYKRASNPAASGYVGKEVVSKHWNKLGGTNFKDYKPRRVEFKKLEPIQFDTNLPKCYICDLDGTICDSNGIRSPYDYSKVGLDKPIKPVIEVIKHLLVRWSNGFLFVSGRDDSCREDTTNWLFKWVGKDWEGLFMRKTGDHRPDYIVKREILEDIATRWCPVVVFDDRSSVVRMWRASGLTCLQVAEGMY